MNDASYSLRPFVMISLLTPLTMSWVSYRILGKLCVSEALTSRGGLGACIPRMF